MILITKPITDMTTEELLVAMTKVRDARNIAHTQKLEELAKQKGPKGATRQGNNGTVAPTRKPRAKKNNAEEVDDILGSMLDEIMAGEADDDC